MTNIEGKNVVVLGFGLEGQATAKFLNSNGAKVTIANKDATPNVPEEYDARLGSDYLRGLDEFDLVIPSPGIPRAEIKTSKPIVSPTQLFLEHCPAPVIGVTGTKGKGTTSTLIAKMLEYVGKTVHLGGNIGRPALDFLHDIGEEDLVVLELSSFQLYDVTISPHIAVVLMIEPDHMDWHTNMEDYIAAKAHITLFQTEDDYAIYHAKNEFSHRIAEQSEGTKIAYMSDAGAHLAEGDIVIDGKAICKAEEVGLIGPHNLENICAALTAVWQVSKDESALAEAVRNFKGLEHRLEFVREVGGIKFYNDSISTTPGSTIAGIRSFNDPIILIVGGSSKGSDYAELGREITESNVKHIVTIGDTGPAILKAVDSFKEKRNVGRTVLKDLSAGADAMSKIIESALRVAEKGDVVLLSPAAASFGLFESYKQRGDLFKQVVNSL